MDKTSLKHFFELNCKPSASESSGQKLGPEYECMVLIPDRDDSSAQSYRPLGMAEHDGVPKVLRKFKEVASNQGEVWKEKFEGENLIGLQSQDGANITVEPGGQIELSDHPMDNLSQLEISIRNFVRNLKDCISTVNGRLMFLGAQPLHNLDEIPLSPKKRYRIMYRHMPKVGSLGQWMMKATAGCQLSLDYASIEDLERKFRIICRLSPFLTAIFSNSPLHLGKPSGYKSFRGHIWQNTDETRSGIPESFISKKFKIEDYIDWALTASPYHLNRQGEIHELMNHSFKDLISGSHPKIKTNFEDWKEHLGMLFPEIRIKNIIEIRSIDAINPEYVLAVPALLQALIYDETVFGKLESILMDLPENEFPWYQQVAARDGLAGQVNQVNFSKFCKNLVEMALENLNLSEGCALALFFDDYTRHGISPADLVLDRYFSTDKNSLKWINEELRSDEAKQSSFINFPCDFNEKSISLVQN